MWNNNTGVSVGAFPGRAYFGPLFLILTPPVFAIFLGHAVQHEDASLAPFWARLQAGGVAHAFAPIWPSWAALMATAPACLAFMAFQALLQLFVPAAEVHGPVAPSGHVPVYKDNGLRCWFISLAAYYYAAYVAHWIEPGFSYDLHVPFIAFMSLFAAVFCVGLFVKGHLAPSTADSGSSGNWVVDYYWGMELYPRVFGVDIKTLTNCRWGLALWFLLPLDWAGYQIRTHGSLSTSMAVSLILHFAYVTKFFWWESGYWRSIDIMHDRAGWYICWGCFVWVPSLYTVAPLYLAGHPRAMSDAYALFVLVAGLLAILINYDIDRQRQTFRAKRGVSTPIWGAKPTFIVAKYKTDGGRDEKNRLLTSGYFALARHLNYVFEITLAVMWTVPCGFIGDVPFAYSYVIFLTFLLIDRGYRDDARCEDKYGAAWRRYMKKVPSRFIPGIW